MQIAERNGNLKIAGPDEGRNMLINELKSDWISQADVPQGEQIERRQNGTLVEKSPSLKNEEQMQEKPERATLGQCCPWYPGRSNS